jgi:hypothetical protein
MLQLVLAPALKQQRENQAAATNNATTATDSSHIEHPLPRVAFAFDSGAKSFRQTLYPAYKVYYTYTTVTFGSNCTVTTGITALIALLLRM